MTTLSAQNRFTALNYACVSALWFSLYTQWIALVVVIVPMHVSDIVGSSRKELDTGLVLGLGAWIALIVAPLAGALSDRTRAPRGRRRPFLIVGVVGSCVALALFLTPAAGTNIWIFAAVFGLWQFFGNWAAGPYAGLIPDVVPENGRATASGWMTVMTVLGSGLGVAAAGWFVAAKRYAGADAFLIVVMLGGLGVTLLGVREPPAQGAAQPFALGAFMRSFALDPGTNRNFYWVLITRLLANMGVWSVSEFFLFYVSEVLGISGSAATTIGSSLIAVGSLVALASAVVGAWLSDRYGRVPVLRAGGWIMAIASAFFVLIGVAPNLWLLAATAIVYYIGYGAYQSVDWALALDVLPDLKEAGKDMGIWHVALVLPQIIAPPTTGWLIYVLKTTVSTHVAYTAAFGLAAVWFALAAALIVRVRVAPPLDPN